MMLGLSLSLSQPRGGGWTPAKLGGALLGWWDASRADLITQSGGSVSSWKDIVGAYDCTQATGASKPTYSATGFNGGPCLTFDGADDFLSRATSPFPSTNNPVEMWALVDQTALVADTTSRRCFSYDGSGNNTSRQLMRAVQSSMNRASAVVGSGAASAIIDNANVDLSGRHVIRCAVGAAATQIDVDGTAGASTAATLGTSAGVVRIGSNTAGTAANFWQGSIAAILVTSPLSAVQAAQLNGYLKSRGGIV